LTLCLICFPAGMASLGRAAATDAKASVTVGLTAGALAGVFFGLVFGGVRGKWRDKVFGPDGGDEAEPAPSNSYSPSDESLTRLKASGWSVGEAKVLTPVGPQWR
jgi:hypothetical protein